MSEWPKRGDRMKFMNRGGYESEREAAAAVFKAADTLTVLRCEVGSWSHSLWFEESPARGWNGVMFDHVDGPERYPLPTPPVEGKDDTSSENDPLREAKPDLSKALQAAEQERDEAIRANLRSHGETQRLLRELGDQAIALQAAERQLGEVRGVLEPFADLAHRLRQHRQMMWNGDVKPGVPKCQLVPLDLLNEAIKALASLPLCGVGGEEEASRTMSASEGLRPFACETPCQSEDTISTCECLDPPWCSFNGSCWRFFNAKAPRVTDGGAPLEGE